MRYTWLQSARELTGREQTLDRNRTHNTHTGTTMVDAFCSFAEDYWSSYYNQSQPPPSPSQPQEVEQQQQVRAPAAQSQSQQTMETAPAAAATEQTAEQQRTAAAAVEQTIHGMEDAGCCAHPEHYHSFRPLPLLGSGGGAMMLLSLKKNKRECAACRESISVLPFGGGGGDRDHHHGDRHGDGGDDPAVRCVACGVLAHRSCASDRRLMHLWKQRECAVNAARLRQQQQRQRQKQEKNGTRNDETKEGNNGEEEEEIVCFENPAERRKSMWKDDEAVNDNQQHEQTSSQTVNDITANEEEETASPPPPPPPPSSSSSTSNNESKVEADEDENKEQSESKRNKQRNNGEKKKPALPFPNENGAQSFASVARALQENVLKSFNHPAKKTTSSKKKKKGATRRRRTAPYPGARAARQAKAKQQQQQSKQQSSAVRATTITDDVTENIAYSALSTEEESMPPPPPPPILSSPSRSKPENSAIWDAVKSKVNVGVVAGAIAGGAAGLALAGPAGAYVGYMAAGSVLAEGAVGAASVGVVAAGLATGTVAGHQINERIEERVLTMGEEGASQKVLLVRPNIQLDPVWNQIMQEARRSAPPRNRRTLRTMHSDSDITMTEEDEIGTSDKVLLLVSRMLNDKTSLAGHMYRYLIETFRDRARQREALCASSDSIAAVSPRARRDDAHAVIKHVTACLLEERPELGSSSGLTEVAANAVEGLVFGQLYDSVYEEIALETMELDAALWRKITVFEAEHGSEKKESSMAGLISETAMAALTMLPEAHSATDKLHFGVKFLDRVSEHFANTTDRSVCADSLLKMVCQHMVFAENRGGLNSQIGFLEEFARDQQLLRGREGYALVTMQASLHFLNMATDLYQEIFADDDDDDDDELLLEGSNNEEEEEEEDASSSSHSADIASTVSTSLPEGDHRRREEPDNNDSTAASSACDDDDESFASCQSG